LLISNYLDFLLRFERQVGCDGFGDLEWSENALISFLVNLFIMADVLRVLALGRDLKATLSTKVCMGLQHTGLTIEDQRVVELRDVDLVPSLAEDYVAHHYLVLECCSEASIWGTFLYLLLDLPSDTRDSPELGTSELCNF
jgi:hypothetical protein